MGHWILLETGAELTTKIQELKKKCAKRVLSNYLFSDEHINSSLQFLDLSNPRLNMVFY